MYEANSQKKEKRKFEIHGFIDMKVSPFCLIAAKRSIR